MKTMKRQLCALLVIALFFAGTFASAEVGATMNDNADEAHSSVFDEIGDAIRRALDAMDDTADDIKGFLSQAGDALGGAMDDAGQALASAWESTTDAAGNAWGWIEKVAGEQGGKLSQTAQTALSQLKAWLEVSGDNALKVLRAAFETVADGIGIVGGKAEALWNALKDYAEEKEIDLVVVVKLALAVMVRISLGRQVSAIAIFADRYIGEEVRIIMGWFTCFGIDSEEAAEQAIALLRQALNY